MSAYPIKFYRQRVVGAYILDFYCSEASLAVELDGSQHYMTDAAEMRDLMRTDYLMQHGIMVIRFANLEVHENFRGVCEEIDRIVTMRLSTKGSPVQADDMNGRV